MNLVIGDPTICEDFQEFMSDVIINETAVPSINWVSVNADPVSFFPLVAYLTDKYLGTTFESIVILPCKSDLLNRNSVMDFYEVSNVLRQNIVSPAILAQLLASSFGIKTIHVCRSRKMESDVSELASSIISDFLVDGGLKVFQRIL